MKRLFLILMITVGYWGFSQVCPQIDTFALVPVNAPTNPVEGQGYYDQTSKKVFVWNGTQWLDLAASGSDDQTSGEVPYLNNGQANVEGALDDLYAKDILSLKIDGNPNILTGSGFGIKEFNTGTGLNIGLLSDETSIQGGDVSNNTNTSIVVGVNSATILGLSNSEIDAVGDNSLITKSYADANYGDDQVIDAFALNGTNLELSLENDGQAIQTVDLSSLQDGTGTDDQNAGEVAVAAIPSNYSAATQDVEAHLAGIDVALASAGGSLSTDNQNKINNAGEVSRVFYTTEDVTTTVANQKVQSGNDIGKRVINTVSGSTTATATLTNTDVNKVDVYWFDVLDDAGQWDISANGFEADSFGSNNLVRIDGIGGVNFTETGVNTDVFHIVPGANVTYVTTTTNLATTANAANPTNEANSTSGFGN